MSNASLNIDFSFFLFHFLTSLFSWKTPMRSGQPHRGFFISICLNDSKTPKSKLFGVYFLCFVKHCIPNNRKDDSNEQEDKACYKKIAVVKLLYCIDLTFAVIDISFDFCMPHRDKKEQHSSENEAHTHKCSLAADIHQASKKRHQYTWDEESIGQNLDIYRCAMCEKALWPNHKECDQRLNAKTNSIIS